MGANVFALTGNVVTMTAAPNARVVYVENQFSFDLTAFRGQD